MIVRWNRIAAMAALAACVATPALAQVGNAPITVVRAPAPVAGAGLPFLLLAGGYALVRRYRSRRAVS